jgi:hypothetical protein
MSHYLASALVGLFLFAGCAAAGPAQSPDRLDGVWVGTISPRGGALGASGATAGVARLTLVQRQEAVQGTLTMPGVVARVSGIVRGRALQGSVDGRSHQGAGNLPLELTLGADGTLAGVLESSPISLRRYP